MQGDASFNPAVFAWDATGQERTHDVRLVYQGMNDPLNAVRQSALIYWGEVPGHEAWDYANPYRLTAAQLLTKPALIPDYGIRGDTAASVAANIQRMSPMLEST